MSSKYQRIKRVMMFRMFSQSIANFYPVGKRPIHMHPFVFPITTREKNSIWTTKHSIQFQTVSPRYFLNQPTLKYRWDPRGGQKTKWKTPSSNFEELIESITNMLLFFAGGSRKKSYEVSKFGGGGGGSMP